MIDVQCGISDDGEECENPQINEMELMAWEQEKSRLKRHGFVAFLDLLGFSQIAKTDDESVIENIFSIIKNCRDDAKKKLDEIDHQDMETRYFQGSTYEDIDISFISDSIVLHRDLLGSEKLECMDDPNLKFDIGLSGYWFIRLVREIFSDLLRKELPSRCGVAYGNYFWDADAQSIMAGRALIEAHDVSEHLAFPGIVIGKSITDNCSDTFDELTNCTPLENFFIHDFDIPLKGFSNPRVEKGCIVRPSLTKDEIGDVGAFIARQFKSNGKEMPEKFSWGLRDWEKEVLYKHDMSAKVFRRLYV